MMSNARGAVIRSHAPELSIRDGRRRVLGAKRQVWFIGFSLVSSLLLSVWETSAAEVEFDRDVAPLLARRCLECHNDFDEKGGLDLSTEQAALAGGENGVVLVPGKVDQSPLWERIVDGDMPPDEPLSDAEKDVLRRWITDGARWGSDPIDVFKYSSTDRAGYDWWSLRPIVRPVIPVVSERTHNPIDAFVQVRLKENGLSMSPEADRRTLVRRLTFDLTGLPPTPEDVERYIDDDSIDAYERLVDRLLASPAYGERWARHWLDLVRFGESQGFERDKLRDTSWRYRDWVVRAFNEDMPYDKFTRLQLAGDAMAEAGGDGLVATGFLVAGPWDEVGHKQQSDAMKRVVRQDELEDYISVVGQTFLGLTINCARCHDHKFDPVRQSEYYRLAAALNGVNHGEPTADVEPVDASALRSYRATIDRKIEEQEQPIRERLLAERQQPAATVTRPEPIAHWEFADGLNDQIGTLDGQPHGSAVIRDSRLWVDGHTGYVTTTPIDRDITEKTLEVWLQLDGLPQQGGGAVSLQSLDGTMFDAIVYAEREPFQWMAGSNNFARTQSFEGTEEAHADQEVVHIAIVWHADGIISGYRDGVPYGKPYDGGAPVTFYAGQAQIVFGLRHTPVGGNRLLSATIQRASLYDRALNAEEVAASAGAAGVVSEDQILAELTDGQRTSRQRWLFESDHLHKQIKRAESNVVYAVNPIPQPSTMHVMIRGNPGTPGDAVTPGGVASVLDGKAAFELPDTSSDAERRRALAEWVTHPDNPLFARVMVNRLWQYHFGSGFVLTPSDLGFNGGMPTHPELLDWLAAEVASNGFSLKHMHRLIVTSAAYRQSSRPRDDGLAVDAGNQWLWRKSPQRLQAEEVRDAILAITGQLNDVVGGPGYHDFTTYVHNTQFYDLVDPVGASFNRRSLYRCWVRSGRSPLLDVFDCPDPSTKTPQRAVTTTPLQSLALMNNAFVLRMADRFAEQLESLHPDAVGTQIDEAFRRTYSRTASDDEREQGTAFIAEHGLPAFCRVLLNTNEFLYVE